jgi:two-component system, NarL family, sensor kinase
VTPGPRRVKIAAMEAAPASGEARRGWAVALGGGIVVLLIAGLAFEPRLAELPIPGFVDRFNPLRVGAALGFGLPGAAVVSVQSRNRLGWLMVAIGGAQALSLFLDAYGTLGIHDPDAGLAAPGWALPLASALWAPAFLAVPTLFLLLFPDGRPPSPRWNPVVVVAGVAACLSAVGWALLPPEDNDVDIYPVGYDSPAPTWDGAGALAALGGMLAAVAAVASVGSLVVRYRRSAGAEREQLIWVLVGGGATLVLLGGAFLLGDAGPWAAGVAMVPLPVSVGVAITRLGLWDTDGVLRRLIVSGVLGAGVLAVYLLAVYGIGSTLGERTGAPLVAAGATAVAVGPAHRRVTRWANRVVYGDSDDPAVVLRRLGEHLDAVADSDVIGDVCQTVARAVGASCVSVLVDGAPVATWGHGGDVVEHWALQHGGDHIGDLLVAGAALRPGARTLLRELVPHVALATHTHQLGAELVRSHERLLAARDDERLRLQRDLHDGVGPTLAALALELDRGRLLLSHDPDVAADVLDGLSVRLRDAVAAVRGLVHDLRPPPLDELGLHGALVVLGERFATAAGLAVTVHTDRPLPPVPAAAELACYRIASEAMTNVARHAEATRCDVHLDITTRGLELRVVDDGTGIDPASPPGTGLRSMCERAELLGGCFASRSGPDGTTITAVLPLDHHRADQ